MDLEPVRPMKTHVLKRLASLPGSQLDLPTRSSFRDLVKKELMLEAHDSLPPLDSRKYKMSRCDLCFYI